MAANHRIGFNVSGDGVLIGVGNGNPNCQESDKEPRRSLFNGLAQLVVQSTMERGSIQIEAVKVDSGGPELTPAKVLIATRHVEPRPAVPSVRKG
jgi:beta-galactosidase